MSFLLPRPRLLLAAGFVLFTFSPLDAQTFGQIGERAQGMGGAFVAVADDATAVYWNPAGVAHVWAFDAQAGGAVLRSPVVAEGQDAGKSMFAGAAMPALGLGYYRVRTAVPASDSRENDRSAKVPVGYVTTGNASLSLVQAIVRQVVIGTTLRLVSGPEASAFDLDAGLMVAAGSVRAGLVARNLREPEFEVAGQSDPLTLERQVRVGVAYVPRSAPTGVNGPFSVAFDADLTTIGTPDGETRRAAVGSEQWWKRWLATRFGVQWSTLPGAAERAFSGGLTVRLPHSLYAEGHVTKGDDSRESGWGVGLRVAF